jgi:hypothetical protein
MALLTHAVAVATGGADATTSAISTTGATLIVVGIENISNGVNVTDSASNTWTFGTLFNASSSRKGQMAYCVNPTTSGTHTFSLLAAGGAFYPVLTVAAFSNTPAGAFVSEATAAETVSAGTTVQVGSSITPANANNLLVTFVGGDAFATISVDSGFTTTDTSGKVGGTFQGGGLAYIIQTAATAKQPTWTVGSNDATIMALMMEFKENGGGGGGGRGLFRTPSSTGIGVGGSFFRDTLQAREQMRRAA